MRERVLTDAELNRATLARQLLLRRERVPVVAAVQRLGALQAQEPAAPYVALWSRLDGFAHAELAAAIARRAVVRATLMRGTIHLVSRADWAHFQPAMRAAWGARGDALPTDLFAAIEREALAFASRPRAGAELQRLVGALGGRVEPGHWWRSRGMLPLLHAPGDGPWRFSVGNRFVAAPAALRQRLADPEAGARRLLLRHLAAFGPATVGDVIRWTRLRGPQVRLAVEQLEPRLRRLRSAEGARLLDVRGAPLPAGDVPAPPRLLPMWDSVLLAFEDRTRVLAAEHERDLIGVNGDFRPALLVEGRVAGIWRMRDARIELLPFGPLPARARRDLEAEARALEAWTAPHDRRLFARYTDRLA